MKKGTSLLAFYICLGLLSGCDTFESDFYAHIDQGQLNAIKNGSDTFDLSSITDFDWDSVILVRGNESVPVFKEEIEELINNRTSEVHWEDRRFKTEEDVKLIFKTHDLPTFKDRFYFLTPDKKMIEKEIKSGIHQHKPAFSLQYCLVDSNKERRWLSRQECSFIIETNESIFGKGTVFLYPKCKTRFSPDSILMRVH